MANLGPYITALGLVTMNSESRRDANDKIETGKMISSENKFNLAGLFILYRGASMMQEWVKNFNDQIFNDKTSFNRNAFHSVRLSGSSSCTQNLTIALEFAFKDVSKEVFTKD